MRPSVKKIGIYLLSSAIIGLILPPLALFISIPQSVPGYLFKHDFSGYWEMTVWGLAYEALFVGDFMLSVVGFVIYIYLFNVVFILSVSFLIRMLWRLLLAMSRY